MYTYVGQQFDPLRRPTGAIGSGGSVEKTEEKCVTWHVLCVESGVPLNMYSWLFLDFQKITKYVRVQTIVMAVLRL